MNKLLKSFANKQHFIDTVVVVNDFVAPLIVLQHLIISKFSIKVTKLILRKFVESSD